MKSLTLCINRPIVLMFLLIVIISITTRASRGGSRSSSFSRPSSFSRTSRVSPSIRSSNYNQMRKPTFFGSSKNNSPKNFSPAPIAHIAPIATISG